MRTLVLAILALAAAGCHRVTDPAGSSSTGQVPVGTASQPPSGVIAPVATPPTGDDLAAAAQLIRLYYARIGAKDYVGAWHFWWDDGAASGVSEDAFASGFAKTSQTSVTILGRGATEGAAGSIYATIPVRVDALLASGERQQFEGSYVLRRVDDVPGSSTRERRWHIYSASLKPIAADAKKGRG